MINKCKCCNKIYCNIQRKPRLDTGAPSQRHDDILGKRSHTAVGDNFVMTQRFGFPNKSQIKDIQTPQYMAQTTRIPDIKGKDLSIFQHFTISNAYNDEVEKNYVPELAPIDITQDECSQIENDLRRYLESGHKLDSHRESPMLSQNYGDDRPTSFYVAQEHGDWERVDIHSPEYTNRTAGIFNSNYQTIYAQPKPIVRTKAEIPERLIKLKIEREIDKAQFNTLAKLIDLGDFKRLRPRAPKDLLEKIFQPISVERKPFILKKWTSPFNNFKEKAQKRKAAKSVVHMSQN